MQVFILFFFIFPRSMSITPNAIRVPLVLCLLPRMLFGSPLSYVYYPECYSGHPLSMSITPNAIRITPCLCLLPRMLFGSPPVYVYYPECYSGTPRSMSITPNAIRVPLVLCLLPRMLFGYPRPSRNAIVSEKNHKKPLLSCTIQNISLPLHRKVKR